MILVLVLGDFNCDFRIGFRGVFTCFKGFVFLFWGGWEGF